MEENRFARCRAVPFEVYNTCASEKEIERAAGIYEELVREVDRFPVSFALDGAEHKGFSGFELTAHAHAEEELKVSDTLTLRHPCGLEVTALLAHYPEYAAFEWTLWFRNTAEVDSPRINELSSADVVIPGTAPRLSGITGDARNESFGDGVISPTYGMNNQPYSLALALEQDPESLF